MKTSSTLLPRLKPIFSTSSLIQITSTVQDLINEGGLPSDSISDTLQDSATGMPEISTSLNGLFKLFNNLKPGKAAGPDRLKPLLLKELRQEIAPIIQIISERSLQSGKLPAVWVKANVMPVSKKRRQISGSKLSTYFPHLHSLQGARTYLSFKYS